MLKRRLCQKCKKPTRGNVCSPECSKALVEGWMDADRARIQDLISRGFGCVEALAMASRLPEEKVRSILTALQQDELVTEINGEYILTTKQAALAQNANA